MKIVKEAESFNPAPIIGIIREFLQEHPFENEAHNTFEDFEEYIANELFDKEVKELTSEESYAISDVWEDLQDELEEEFLDSAIKDSAVNDSERYLIRKNSGAGEVVYETNDLQDAIEELRALGKSYYIDDTQKDITIKYSQAIRDAKDINEAYEKEMIGGDKVQSGNAGKMIQTLLTVADQEALIEKAYNASDDKKETMIKIFADNSFDEDDVNDFIYLLEYGDSKAYFYLDTLVRDRIIDAIVEVLGEVDLNEDYKSAKRIVADIYDKSGNILETRYFSNRKQLDSFVNNLNNNLIDMTADNNVLFKDSKGNMRICDIWRITVDDLITEEAKKKKELGAFVKLDAGDVEEGNKFFNKAVAGTESESGCNMSEEKLAKARSDKDYKLRGSDLKEHLFHAKPGKYVNTEDSNDYLVIGSNGRVIETSVGEIINDGFGIKINNTKYIIDDYKYGYIAVYSYNDSKVDTQFPFIFKWKDQLEENSTISEDKTDSISEDLRTINIRDELNKLDTIDYNDLVNMYDCLKLSDLEKTKLAQLLFNHDNENAIKFISDRYYKENICEQAEDEYGDAPNTLLSKRDRLSKRLSEIDQERAKIEKTIDYQQDHNYSMIDFDLMDRLDELNMEAEIINKKLEEI